MNTDLITVPFLDHELCYLEHEGQPFVPVKPICERLGLDWSSQGKKLRSTERPLGVVILSLPSAGGPQNTTCLPLMMLPAWLFTVSPNKVRAELKSRVIAYQRECSTVLWRHWSGQASAAVEALRVELNQEKLYRENIQAHLLAGKSAWTRIMHMASLHWPKWDLQHLMGWSHEKMEVNIAAMEECGLLEEREDAHGLKRLYIRTYAPAFIPEARFPEAQFMEG